MSLSSEQDIKHATLKAIAQKMLIAARTAPKGKGADNLRLAIVENESITELSEQLLKLGEQTNIASFIRDANNIKQTSVLLLLGTKIAPLGLAKCGLCGFENCAEKTKHPSVPCTFNTTDLGIAIGSAVSIAADNRVDNRVMYTVGLAAQQMNLLGDDVKIIYAIALSATSKNPFFDRQ